MGKVRLSGHVATSLANFQRGLFKLEYLGSSVLVNHRMKRLESLVQTFCNIAGHEVWDNHKDCGAVGSTVDVPFAHPRFSAPLLVVFLRS